jgi:hypothetical protein
VHTIEEAHNPEVAGSNPAPATPKGPVNRAFPLRAQSAIATAASVFAALVGLDAPRVTLTFTQTEPDSRTRYPRAAQAIEDAVVLADRLAGSTTSVPRSAGTNRSDYRARKRS